ncbi:MAG TPA: M6 family metalloprotease domain-containing protein [Methanosarcinales archaeon]|nr:M6 family metalloprotease domain-containing protein [Methanosarcinales archaeon]
MIKKLSVAMIIALLAIVLTTNAFAMPPKPGLYDTKTGLSKTTGDPLPQKLPEIKKPVTKVIKTKDLGITKATKVKKTKTKAIVILVQFSDNRADTVNHTPKDYKKLLFSKKKYPTGSLRDYYYEISYHKFVIKGKVTDWYTVNQSYNYYVNNSYGWGEYPNNAQKLVEDAVKKADKDIDFSKYDNDGDGYVDALFVVHAGPGAEETGSSGDIWSHAWNTIEPIPVDGVNVSTYTMEPEEHAYGNLISIGVFAHEYGHVLGLPDLYDLDFSSAGIGVYGLMSYGAWGADGYSPYRPTHMCAWSKIQLGWINPIVVTNNLEKQVIHNIEKKPMVYKLWTNGSPENEYFLVSNRQPIGFDDQLNGSGLLIWHVDESVTTQNNNESHKLVDLEEADGLNQLDIPIDLVNRTAYLGDAGDFFNRANNPTFNGTSNPNSDDYNGNDTQVSVTNISQSKKNMKADLKVR